MGHMALTELELAAARRREVVREDMNVRLARHDPGRPGGRRPHGWLTGVLGAAVARSPLARS